MTNSTGRGSGERGVRWQKGWGQSAFAGGDVAEGVGGVSQSVSQSVYPSECRALCQRGSHFPRPHCERARDERD